MLIIKAPAALPSGSQISVWHSSRLWCVFVALAVSAAALWFATFVGYTGSDDGEYLVGARGWLTHFPFVGGAWWQVRHTVVIPMAISIKLFGENEYSIVLPGLLYQIGIVLLGFKFVEEFAGTAAAVAVALLLLTLPLSVISTSIANADLPVVFFMGLSLWLFLSAIRIEERPTPRLLGAGIAAGLAFLSLDMTVGLLLVYGILFLAGFGMPRRRYWVMAIGFAAIVGCEMVYYGVTVGDPFHRFEITLANAAAYDRSNTPGSHFDGTGALRVHPIVDPFLVVFARIDFGLLFFFFIPAAIWTIAHRKDRSMAAIMGRIVLLSVAVCFAFSAIALQHKILLTRYYLMPAFAAAVAVGTWVGVALWPRRRYLAVLAMALLLCANMGALYAANKDPLFGERLLVEYLESHRDIPFIVTDPELASRGGVLLEWAGLSSRVKTDPPKAGELYFYYPATSAAPTRHVSAEALPLYQPQRSWAVLWRRDRDRKFVGKLMEASGLDRFLPAPIRDRLNRPSPGVTVYRIAGYPPYHADYLDMRCRQAANELSRCLGADRGLRITTEWPEDRTVTHACRFPAETGGMGSAAARSRRPVWEFPMRREFPDGIRQTLSTSTTGAFNEASSGATPAVSSGLPRHSTDVATSRAAPRYGSS